MRTTLLDAWEFAKLGWSAGAFGANANQAFDFANKIDKPTITALERNCIVELVGSVMYKDMITKRNTLSADYTDANALVLLFPNDANYESLFSGFGALNQYLYAALEVAIREYQTVQITNAGTVQVNGNDFEPVTQKDNSIVNTNIAMKKRAALREVVKEFLCENKADYPLLRADLCEQCLPCLQAPNTNNIPKTSAGGKLYNQWGIYIM